MSWNSVSIPNFSSFSSFSNMGFLPLWSHYFGGLDSSVNSVRTSLELRLLQGSRLTLSSYTSFSLQLHTASRLSFQWPFFFLLKYHCQWTFDIKIRIYLEILSHFGGNITWTLWKKKITLSSTFKFCSCKSWARSWGLWKAPYHSFSTFEMLSYICGSHYCHFSAATHTTYLGFEFLEGILFYYIKFFWIYLCSTGPGTEYYRCLKLLLEEVIDKLIM